MSASNLATFSAHPSLRFVMLSSASMRAARFELWLPLLVFVRLGLSRSLLVGKLPQPPPTPRSRHPSAPRALPWCSVATATLIVWHAARGLTAPRDAIQKAVVGALLVGERSLRRCVLLYTAAPGGVQMFQRPRARREATAGESGATPDRGANIFGRR